MEEDKFIKLLLRSYTGMFTEYRPIDEDELAKRANVTRDVITGYLIKLGRDKIITYIPRKKEPQIFYTEERLDTKSVAFTTDKYINRKRLYKSRIESVINYATHKKCRSQQLLFYFGDNNAERCGVCDVCTERNKLDLSKLEFDQILEQVKQKLQAPMTTEQLIDAIKFPPEKVISVIQWLLDNDKLDRNDQMMLVWKSL